MYYIIGNGQIIDQSQSCPTEDDLKALADEYCLRELWVIKGEHSGIAYSRPEPPAIKSLTRDFSAAFNMYRTECDPPF